MCQPGTEPGPWQWGRGILATGPPGNSFSYLNRWSCLPGVGMNILEQIQFPFSSATIFLRITPVSVSGILCAYLFSLLLCLASPSLILCFSSLFCVIYLDPLLLRILFLSSFICSWVVEWWSLFSYLLSRIPGWLRVSLGSWLLRQEEEDFERKEINPYYVSRSPICFISYNLSNKLIALRVIQRS